MTIPPCDDWVVAAGRASEQFVDVEHITHTESHEAYVGAGVDVDVGVHVEIGVFGKYHRLQLHPVVAFALYFPVFARAHHVGGVVFVECPVAPVVDLKQEAGKPGVIYPGVVDMETVAYQLAYP